MSTESAEEPLLWSMRTEEETDQLLEMCRDRFPGIEPFNEGISASISSAFSQIMRRDTTYNEYIENPIDYQI